MRQKDTYLELIETLQLTSYMNHTKWIKFIDVINNTDIYLECRLKMLIDEKDPVDFCPIDWEQLILFDELKLIYWIEINPKKILPDHLKTKSIKFNDYSESIKDNFLKSNIPFEFVNGIFKISGYK